MTPFKPAMGLVFAVLQFVVCRNCNHNMSHFTIDMVSIKKVRGAIKAPKSAGIDYKKTILKQLQ
ncbi:MAG: hypothetical protein ACXWEP_00415 [Halobacteriota archaeon]